MPALDMLIVHKVVPADSGQAIKEVFSADFAAVRQLVLAARCGQPVMSCGDEEIIEALAVEQVLEGVRAFDGSSSSAKFFAGATADGGATTSTTFSASDAVLIAGSVSPQIRDVGQAAKFFIVVRTIINGQSTWAYRNLAGNFEPWSTRVSELEPAYEIESLDMLEAFVAYRGTLQQASHRIFIGYSLQDGSGPPHYNELGLPIEVE